MARITEIRIRYRQEIAGRTIGSGSNGGSLKSKRTELTKTERIKATVLVRGYGAGIYAFVVARGATDCRMSEGSVCLEDETQTYDLRLRHCCGSLGALAQAGECGQV